MTEKTKSSISYLLASIIIAYLGFSFLGIQLGISAIIYDEQRLLQFILFIVASIHLICFKNTLPKQACYTLSIAILFASLSYPTNDGRIWSDLCTYLLLIIFTFSVSQLNRPILPSLILIIGLLPCLTLIWLIITLSLVVIGEPYSDAWHNSFGNIRTFNDALLPCLFILFSQVQNLCSPPKKSFKYFVSFILILYIFSLLIDGARAVVLSSLLAVVVTFIIKRDVKSLFFFSRIFIIAGITFSLCQLFLDGFKTHELIRTSSSGRTDLWLDAFETWLHSPITGTGGNPITGYSFNHSILMHPHNLYLQFMAEWGALGLAANILALLFLSYVIKNSRNVNFFLLAGVIASYINTGLSGMMIYPVSQINTCILIGVTLAQIYQAPPHTQHSQIIYVKIPIALLIILLCNILFWHNYNNYTLLPQTSEQNESIKSPRFWQNGQTTNLIPISSPSVPN